MNPKGLVGQQLSSLNRLLTRLFARSHGVPTRRCLGPKHVCFRPEADVRGLSPIKSLLEVGPQILDELDANAEPE